MTDYGFFKPLLSCSADWTARHLFTPPQPRGNRIPAGV